MAGEKSRPMKEQSNECSRTQVPMFRGDSLSKVLGLLDIDAFFIGWLAFESEGGGL
ncbi:hypothetical protein RISK_000104 [Rhodopirellula islandica]|uniref:Uncharacterized protein n=1 Tax=Rhodopirellula islandica TaxID=595434 RepID=A0A0J1BN95_RHOIS|nr:hypothetical protein RISK_000104 [Rhodopirellula islandica]